MVLARDKNLVIQVVFWRDNSTFGSSEREFLQNTKVSRVRNGGS